MRSGTLQRLRFILPGAAVMAAPVIAVVVAPPAAADCESAGGVTICAQGSVESDINVGGASGPYYPYPCEDDWLCSDGGLDLIVAPPPSPPGGGIDIGRPGRPGNRP